MRQACITPLRNSNEVVQDVGDWRNLIEVGQDAGLIADVVMMEDGIQMVTKKLLHKLGDRWMVNVVEVTMVDELVSLCFPSLFNSIDIGHIIFFH